MQYDINVITSQHRNRGMDIIQFFEPGTLPWARILSERTAPAGEIITWMRDNAIEIAPCIELTSSVLYKVAATDDQEFFIKLQWW